jgi:hypothetical protein
MRSVGAVVLGAALVAPFWAAARSDASPSPVPSRSAASPSPKPTKSSTPPVFVGPAGWYHANGKSDGLGTWLRSGNTRNSESIVVQAKDGFPSLDALYKAEVSYIAGLPDQFGYAPTKTTVCSDHPAWYMSYTYTSSSGDPATVELVIAVFGTTGYSARYSKSISDEANVAAERSLTTLCPRAASH